MVFDGRYLDLRFLTKREDETFDISRNLDLSSLDTCFDGVCINGGIINKNGYLTARFTISGNYNSVCDLCLDPVTLHLEAEIDTVVNTQEAKDDSITVEDGKADMLKTAYDALLLEIPTQVVCSDTCKGLCYKCGTNLNHRQCNCNN